MSTPSEQWEDLFALAEGRPAETYESDAPVNTSPTTPAKKKLRKNNGQSSTSCSLSKKDKRRIASSRDDYLSERLSNFIQVPQGFTYGSSLVGGRGGNLRFRQKLVAIQAHPLLKLFCCIRNLRHVLFLTIKENVAVSIYLIPFVNELKSLKGQLSFLDGKTKEKTWKLMNSLAVEQKRSSLEFHRIVPLMVDCDSVYYDLYYMQLTSPYQQTYFLPHPTFYFGESIIELSRAVEYVESCRNRKKDDALLKSRFPMHEGMQNEDPFTFLHHVRFLETIQIFHLSGWYSRTEKRRDEFLRAGRDPLGTDLYNVHETPAPSLLRTWRDSCRDFLTHLYAYTTIPEQTRKGIQEFAGTQRIVDVGAGTAYLACLLQQQGQLIDAFDIHPGQQNEYHGATPPFTKINPGTGVKVVLEERQPFVLLLCYPPPDSAMALDVLNTFLKRGGQQFIYVGEFKGLTGTPSFEHMLVNNFRCVKRVHCPTWGTDDASITFWQKRHHGDKISDVLLPCFLCSQESSHRLRYARYLTFCSKQCWKKANRSEAISNHLKLSTIQLGPSLLTFGDETAFYPLR